MSDQFVGEIRMVGFNFAPVGWALCNGQLLPISQNTALFSLLGTQFGGNGTSTFALPNLQSQTPIDQGQSVSGLFYQMGEVLGTETVTLLYAEMAQHNHTFGVSSATGTVTSPANAVLSQTASGTGRDPLPGNLDFLVPTGNANVTMAPTMIGFSGGSQPHPNIQPFLTVNFIIALQGIFPTRS
jgi:microcystin-dependent protein